MIRRTRARRFPSLAKQVSVSLHAGIFCFLIGNFAHAQTDEPRFAVRGFEIEGDLPIARERAQAVLAPFSGDAITLDQLQNAATALEAELTARGFSFYRVVLPPQALEGVVTLRVLPFRLANIVVAGNEHFSTENILASLPALKAGESPNLAQIGRNRSAANEHPSKDIEVTFRQSEVADSVDADVTVRDQPPLSMFVGLNNTGEQRTGRWRASLGFQHSNLWGLDHSVTASYTTSPGHWSEVKQYGFNYRVPFYGVAGALTVSYAHSDVNSGTIANAFEVSGQGEFGGIHWRQHLTPIGAYSHTVEVGVDDRLFDNNVIFGTTQLGVDVRSRPLILGYQARVDRAESIIAAGVQYARNLGGGSDNTDAAYMGNRFGASRSWQALRYSVDGTWRVGSGAVSARLRGQAADEPLIPGEQFGLGGATSVRGLREREVTGDSGFSLTVEGLVPTPWEGLNGVVFFDGGEVLVKNAVAGQQSKQDVTSLGFGVRWTYARKLSVSIDAAQVLKAPATSESGDRRIHASLLYRF